MDCLAGGGQPRDTALANLERWFAGIDARPSAQATLAPNWRELGMRM
ncbi:MAG: hypothetical protein L0H83_10150 [Salinisphaera sp.]|nr:hypothetical protein [Salinisphaera sp.]